MVSRLAQLALVFALLAGGTNASGFLQADQWLHYPSRPSGGGFDIKAPSDAFGRNLSGVCLVQSGGAADTLVAWIRESPTLDLGDGTVLYAIRPTQRGVGGTLVQSSPQITRCAVLEKLMTRDELAAYTKARDSLLGAQRPAEADVLKSEWLRLAPLRSDGATRAGYPAPPTLAIVDDKQDAFLNRRIVTFTPEFGPHLAKRNRLWKAVCRVAMGAGEEFVVLNGWQAYPPFRFEAPLTSDVGKPECVIVSLEMQGGL